MSAPVWSRPTTHRLAIDPSELDAALRYWGLPKCPLAAPRSAYSPVVPAADEETFYHAGPTRQQATRWLRQQVTRATPLCRIAAARGAGLTAWMRQIASTAGIDDQPIDGRLTTARDFHVLGVRRSLARWKQAAAASAVPLVWLLDDADEATVAHLQAAIDQKPDPGASSGTVVVVCGVRKRVPGDFQIAAPEPEELAQCAAAALRDAGQWRPWIRPAALARLAGAAERRYDRLATLIHALLIWGAQTGKGDLDEADVRECLGEVVEPSRDHRWQRRRAAACGG